MRKSVVLRDGTTVRIEPVNGKEDVREFQRFINTLTREGTYLLVDKPVTLKEKKMAPNPDSGKEKRRTNIPKSARE